MATRIDVLGIGNVLMGDDALGPSAVRRLQADYEFPESVRVHEIGTPGLDLVPHIDGVDVLILIDTVRASGLPGDVKLFRRDEILAHPPQPRVSPHDPGLKETLLTLEFAGRAPREVLLVGVVPASTAQGVGLSPPVREALPAVVEEVVSELERHGQTARRREAPVAAENWWER
jgi:hydrogenase maturation protease